MDKTRILQAYSLIGGQTPLEDDCGLRCGKACCVPDEDGQGGMYLFPGEEELYENETWCHILPDPVHPILVCDGPCPRDRRPLACRIFPATPVFSKGVWNIRMDARARAVCPLAQSGVRGLRRDFCLAVRGAVRLIAEDPEGEAFLQWWQSEEEAFRGFTL